LIKKIEVSRNRKPMRAEKRSEGSSCVTFMEFFLCIGNQSVFLADPVFDHLDLNIPF